MAPFGSNNIREVWQHNWRCGGESFRGYKNLGAEFTIRGPDIVTTGLEFDLYASNLISRHCWR